MYYDQTILDCMALSELLYWEEALLELEARRRRYHQRLHHQHGEI